LSLRLASTGKVVSAPVGAETSIDCSSTEDYENGYDAGATDDTEGVDDSGDDVADDSGDDVADDDAGDDADASAARVIRADDEPTSDYVPADDSDLTDGDVADDGSADTCGDLLDAGVWVHESVLGADDAGASVFDALALIADDE